MTEPQADRQLGSLRLLATVDQLPRLQAAVADWVCDLKAICRQQPYLELALEEIFVNICSHAYPDAAGEVEVCGSTDASDGLILQISDWGIPFDPTFWQPPDLEEDILQRRIGGLGTYMIQKLTNQVHYRRDGQRNILTVVIHDSLDRLE